MLKKLTATFLAICIALALLPVASAQEPTTHTYNFGTRTTGTTNWEVIFEFDYSDTDGNWAYFTKSTATVWGRDPSLSCSQYLDGHIRVWQDKGGQWVALKLKVPAAGIYSVDMMYRQINNTSAQTNTGVYWLPSSVTGATLVDGKLPEANPANIANIEDALSAQPDNPYKLGNYSTYNKEVSTGGVNIEDPLNLGVVTVTEPGEYLLVIRHEEASSTANRYALIRSITLTEVAAKLSTVQLTAPDKILTYRSAETQVSASMTDGSAVNISTATVSYESSNDAIIAIDSTGLMTAVGEGTAVITASVTYDGVTESASKTIEVVPEVRYDLTNRTSAWKALPEIKAAHPTTGDTNIIGITYSYTGDGTDDGNWAYYGKDSSVWEHEGPEKTNNLIISQYLNNRLRIWPSSTGQWMAFKLKIPAAGRYSAGMLYTEIRSTSGDGNFDIHLMPASVTGAELTEGMLPAMDAAARGNVQSALSSGEYKQGTINSYYRNTDIAANETINVEEPEDLGIFIADAPGEYLLVFEYRSTGTLYCLTRELILESLPVGLSNVSLTLPSGLNVGATAQVQVNGAMSDGAVADLEGANTNYSSSSDAVAIVDANGLVTAVAAGTAAITATVTLNDDTVKGTAIVNVAARAKRLLRDKLR